MLQQYDIILDGQLGQRSGTLTWTEQDGCIDGSFFLLGYDNPIQGTRHGHTLELHHQLRTAVRTLDCETHLELCEDALSGVVTSNHSKMNFRGKRRKKGSPHEIPKQD